MQLVIITGMSGAGKTLACRVLEDVGYYCTDNLPPALIDPFLQLCRHHFSGTQKVALVTDIRSGGLFGDLKEALNTLKAQGHTYRILYLDCADEVLCRRFKEVRRPHPLAKEGTSMEEALTQERRQLEPVSAIADYRVDTSHLSTSQLKQQVTQLFLDKPSDALTVHCMSFGFKHGFPGEADLMLDVRCFPNPFYRPALRPKTGLDKEVRDFVLNTPQTQEFLQRLTYLLDYMLPLYQQEGKTQLVIAIGCTGGQHRSVAIAHELARRIGETGLRVLVNDRDMHKT